MGSKMGYQYHYIFRLDDEMIPRFSNWYIAECDMRFVFEIRTKFVLRGVDGFVVETIDSEEYDVGAKDFWSERYRKTYLEHYIGRRLRDYWMSTDEIRELARGALAFAQRAAADPKYTYCSIVPVVVGLQVCTVQQEGEAISAARGRAIRPESLYPMHLCPVNEAARPKGRSAGYGKEELDLMIFLRYKLKTYRVKDVQEDDLDVMQECCICYHKPVVGVLLSELRCNHIFHNHCIVRWLGDNNSCPVCRQRAHDYLGSSIPT